MKKRIYSLKEIYSIRGVDFEGKKLKFKLLSYIPVLSILLEDSLEKSFDIGEASYVRGFLSTKRSVYDRQKYSYFDYIISLTCIVIVLIYLVIKLLGLDAFDIYNFGITSFSLNKGVVIISMLFFILLMELIFLWRKFVVRYESYKI
jgi:energy-coupling factor transport system permease protein